MTRSIAVHLLLLVPNMASPTAPRAKKTTVTTEAIDFGDLNIEILAVNALGKGI
jgi:hypothetical protein